MGFLDRFRQQLSAANIGGYGGGTLRDELDPRLISSGDVNAPRGGGQPLTNAQPLTAPRPIASAAQAPAPAPTAAAPAQVDAGPAPVNPINYDPTTGRPTIAKSAAVVGTPAENQMAQYQALQGWEPHGGKRGLKNSLKAGLMYASDAVKANPRDPVTALLAGFGTGALGATASPNFKNRLTKDWELRKTGADLSQQLGLQKEQAQIGSLQANAGIRQGSLAERQVNDALGQYNRLEHYDPDDPADAGLKQIFESRGLRLPAKDKYHRPIASWVNGQLVMTDSEGSHAATIDGKPLQDIGRTPNAKGLTANQQAIQDSNTASRESRESEGDLNRKVRISEGAKGRSAAMARTKILAGVQVGKLGDPDVYEEQATMNDGYAKDLEDEAKSQVADGHPTAAARLQKQAAELRAGSTRLRTAASGAKGARQAIGGGQPPVTGQPKYQGRIITTANLQRYATDHGIGLDEAKKVFEGATIVP